jgi:hypothetical protein
MGGFETAQAKATPKQALPADVPDATAAATQHPEGSIFKADNGTRYRLRHARTVAARWAPVVARKPKPAATASSKK